MTKYRVYLAAVASAVIEVEADNEDDALDMAYENAPSNNITTDFELGDWSTSSELFPEFNKPEDDIEVID
jgi:hypothetical protein